MRYLLKSLTASATAGRPMYFSAPGQPYTDDWSQAATFAQWNAEQAQRESAGWLEAVPINKAKPVPQVYGAARVAA